MASEGLVNGVYYPSWRIYRDLPPSSLQLDCVTHVYYAFVLVNEEGELVFMDEWADCQIDADGAQGCLAAVAQLKEAKPGLKVLVSLGGGTGSGPFAALAADPGTRAAFAENCRRFVDERGFDGVDVDWEHPDSEAAGADYLALLADLRAALPAPDYVLTTALPPGEWVLRNIDVAAAADLLDALNLMGYDFHGGWTETCGHHAQLLPGGGDDDDGCAPRASCHAGVEYLIARGFPAAKIVLGVPVYGRSFRGAGGPGEPFAEAGEIDYNELPREWIQDAVVDEAVGAASYVDPNAEDGRGFVSFDVPATVRHKADYVRAQGLGGLFYWTGVGDHDGPESLVRAGWEGLHA